MSEEEGEKSSVEECEIFSKNPRKTILTSNSRGFHYSGCINIFLVQPKTAQDFIKHNQILAQISAINPAVPHIS